MCPLGGPLVGAGGSWLSRGRLVCHCLVIETPSSGLCLVDTGLGLEDLEHPRERLGAAFVAVANPTLDRSQAAVSQLKTLGFRPEDVQHIVLTHMDLDHAGGLSDFAHARVHVMRDELDEAVGQRSVQARGRYKPAQWSHAVQWRAHSPSRGERWFGFDCVRALEGLPEEILMVPLGGHSRGHAAVAVQTPDGWLLHCGDAYFHHGEMEPNGRCPPGLRAFQTVVAHHDALRRANQGRLRDLVRAHGDQARVFCAHDERELRRELARSTSSTRAKP